MGQVCSSGVWGKLESESGKKEREARGGGGGGRNEAKIVECVSIDGIIDCNDVKVVRRIGQFGGTLVTLIPGRNLD